MRFAVYEILSSHILHNYIEKRSIGWTTNRVVQPFFEKMKAVSRFVAAHRHPRNFLERDKKFRRIKQMNKKTYTGSKIQNHFTAYLIQFVRGKRHDYLEKKNADG